MAIYNFKTETTKLRFIINTNKTQQTDAEFLARGDKYESFIKNIFYKFQGNLSPNQIKQLDVLLRDLTRPYCSNRIDFNLDEVANLGDLNNDNKATLMLKTLSNIYDKYQEYKSEFTQSSQTL